MASDPGGVGCGCQQCPSKFGQPLFCSSWHDGGELSGRDLIVEDEPVPDRLPGLHEVAAARTRAPAMPAVSRDTLWRSSPHLIPGSRGHGIGWQDTKNGPCFVVARIRPLGNKVLDRFPLTEDGWAQAW